MPRKYSETDIIKLTLESAALPAPDRDGDRMATVWYFEPGPETRKARAYLRRRGIPFTEEVVHERVVPVGDYITDAWELSRCHREYAETAVTTR